MTISKYKEGEVEFWRVYVDLHSRKDRRIRLQKRVNKIKTEREAILEERRVTRDLAEQITKLEFNGSRWGDVVERWGRQQELYPTKRYAATTILDHQALMRNWTASWWDRPASELNRGDGRDIDRRAQDLQKSAIFRKKLKVTINVIYTWGIEERLIKGVHLSPVHGLEIKRDRDEKMPEILTIEEIRRLLNLAREQNHEWYPVWAGAVMTGCRSGELHQMKKELVECLPRELGLIEDQKPLTERRYGIIRVQRSWSSRFRKPGPTKGGYWRTLPISSEFYWFLLDELKLEEKKPSEFIFPRFGIWDKGEQARILRGFCMAHQLPSIRFHTLRACFATQLISNGVSPTVVMKICGWKDMKTMQGYIRLAGVDEAGATEVLRFISSPQETMEKAAELYSHEQKPKVSGG